MKDKKTYGHIGQSQENSSSQKSKSGHRTIGRNMSAQLITHEPTRACTVVKRTQVPQIQIPWRWIKSESAPECDVTPTHLCSTAKNAV